MNKQKSNFFIILAIVIGLIYITLFGLKLGTFELKGANQMRYGIDIRGGVEAVYKPKDYTPSDTELENARHILETRLDAKNITDREITVDKQNDFILIRFPWKSDETDFDPQLAISELGETAHLTFRDPEGNILVEGKNVKYASPQISSGNSMDILKSPYEVRLEFDSEGAKLFAQATKSLLGQRISIYMDEILLSSPLVQTEITQGTAVITGMEDMDSARSLSDKINAGTLPFSMESSSNSTISPTLGQGALNVMVQAGIVAFSLICLFMLIFYRLPGFVACIALTLQLVVQLLALSVPQFTLTLPGIAAVILSIGMGVDANIIISERIKEELKSGKNLTTSINSGFHRAFSSVFDGNITVIIVAIILMILGSGAVLSFGYSLLTGVILNFIAGVTATRLMIRSLSSYKFLRNPLLYGAKGVAK